jgi:putative endonuclease
MLRLDRSIHAASRRGVKQSAVHILASRPRGTLYVGVSSNLPQRIWQHRNHVVAGFTATCDVTRPVYYELHESTEAAIRREKRLKHWDRQWKIDLIIRSNPDWADLFDQIAGP